MHAAVTGELVAHWCPDCEQQLPADWQPSGRTERLARMGKFSAAEMRDMGDHGYSPPTGALVAELRQEFAETWATAERARRMLADDARRNSWFRAVYVLASAVGWGVFIIGLLLHR